MSAVGPTGIERRAGTEYAARHLRDLYDIGKLLASFEGLPTVTSVLGIVERAIPLRSAILLEDPSPDADLPPRVSAWLASGPGDRVLGHAVERARQTFELLSGPGSARRLDHPAAHAVVRGPLREACEPTSVDMVVSLPLVVGRSVFGLLQIDACRRFDEVDLAFMGAVTAQIASALDRHYAWKREVALRERAEAAERFQAELLAREQRALADARAAEHRLAFLAEASELLAISLDYRTILESVGRLAASAGIADGMTIDLRHEEDGGREERIVFPAGGLSARPVSTMTVPLRARGRQLGSMEVVSTRPQVTYGHDDHALAEDLARRAALAIDNARLHGELVRAVNRRDDILAVVTHDLRSPLSTILVSAELALRQEPASRRVLNSINAAALRMQRLVEDLVTARKIDGDRLALDIRPSGLRQLVMEGVEAIAPLATTKGIVVRAHVPESLPDVLADPHRIEQVLANLLGNAVKFTPEHGAIDVVARVAPEGEFDEPSVMVSISDTGPGIPADQLAHVFERYWQAEDTKHLGTGLGLAIAKGIVDAHRGRIWVRSEEGSGAEFTFTLPMPPLPAGLNAPAG